MPRLGEHERATRALAAVRRWEKQSTKSWEYRQELQQLPSRLLASGLGQTLAFYAAKGDVHAQIGEELVSCLTRNAGALGRPASKEGGALIAFLENLMKGDLADYRARTREALAYAEWLKRYSAALIPKPEGGGRRTEARP